MNKKYEMKFIRYLLTLGVVLYHLIKKTLLIPAILGILLINKAHHGPMVPDDKG